MKKELLVLLLGLTITTVTVEGQIDSMKQARYTIEDSQDLDAGLFESDNLFRITLKFDISYYKRKKPVDEYLDAELKYFISPTDSVDKMIRLRARGKYRLTFCDFPPVLLNFSVRDSRGTVFSGIDKIKLVPHCKIGYQDYLLREYLIYKLYNELTDNSFKVRLLEIKYIDTGRKSKPLYEYGFLIEPVEIFQLRTRSIVLDNTFLTQKDVPAELMDRIAIFNYMIGNTDWAVPRQHNIQLFTSPDNIQYNPTLIVPYDFDSSGLVNAEYAIPPEGLGIKSFRERLYLGICRDENEFRKVLSQFIEKKERFYSIINDFTYLSKGSKKDMIGFLDQFFRMFDRKNTIIKNLSNSCKKL
ncbi:MAG: hypothetical protein U0X39_08390 [Bacteroidales bacterium]